MNPTSDLRANQFIPDWHARTLKGEFQTYVARGEEKLPLGRLLKIARDPCCQGECL